MGFYCTTVAYHHRLCSGLAVLVHMHAHAAVVGVALRKILGCSILGLGFHSTWSELPLWKSWERSFLYRAWDSVLWSKGFRSHTGFSLHSTWFGVPFWRIWRSNLHGEGVHSTGHGVYSKGSGVSFCWTWGSILQGFEIHRPSDHSKVRRH